MAEVVVSLEFVLSLQERNDNSIQYQPASIITLSKKVLKFFSAHIAENTSTDSRTTNIDDRVSSKKDGGDVEEVLLRKQVLSHDLNYFTLGELKSATMDFNKINFLGWGDYGEVFKGWVDKKTYSPSSSDVGMAITIKKLRRKYRFTMLDVLQLRTVEIFCGGISHPNLVKLLGYCLEDTEALLIYEFMLNGSFDSHHFSKGARPLPWVTRIQILVGAARGLALLHQSEKPATCSRFKTSDIMLDKDFNAKLSDARLEKSNAFNDSFQYVPTNRMGLLYYRKPYAPPEYAHTGRIGVKGAVYGFGIVVLETLAGVPQSGYTTNTSSNTKRLLFDSMKEVDARLEKEYPLKGALLLIELALLCLQYKPESRPSFESVLEMLEKTADIKMKPTRTIATASPSRAQ